MSSEAKAFEKVGIPAEKAAEYAGNKKLCAKLLRVIQIAGVGESGCDKSVGNVLYAVATKVKDLDRAGPLLAPALRYAVEGKISTSVQAGELGRFLNKGAKSFDAAAFEAACGVGVTVTPEEIPTLIQGVLQDNKAMLDSKRYRCQGILMGKLRNTKLKWANGKDVKAAFDKAILEYLGPRTDADRAKPKAPAKAAKKKAKEAKEAKTSDEEAGLEYASMTREQLAKMLMGRPVQWMYNTKEQKAAYQERTGGQVRMRFPPEPNGYLHIGHAKAMNFNFGVATKMGGVCYLRFDDTNPEAEKKEYIDNIKENVKFLGHKPWKITYSSDSFDKLYAFAVQLIKENKAYVCHMSAEQIKESKSLKQKQPPSPWRDRPIAESLREFKRMSQGCYAEGKATLRLKMDITAENPNLWDMVAYRVMYTRHPHAGDKWCVYPTYDYTHCIIDSLEDITHSCCTLEFENRRESYYRLLDDIGIYKPNVWEYGRLNIEYGVLSKRKLRQLVVERWVDGWDDPRLLTINGLRRRGFTAKGINTFCEEMGVSRSTTVWAPYERLERCGRLALDPVAKRRMVVLDPLKVVLTNVNDKKPLSAKLFDFPESMRAQGAEPGPGYSVRLGRTVYIEKKDFRPTANKKYFGLTVGKTVRLLHAINITCERYDADAKGNPTVVYCTADIKNEKKVKKGFLHWISEPSPGKVPLKVRVNLYKKLFTAPNPGIDPETGDKVDFLKQLSKDSKVTVDAYAGPELKGLKPGEKFQFERLGYFVVDDNVKRGTVFNRTMELNQSRDLKKAKGGKKKK